MPAALAILLGTIAVAIGGMMSFGYLMLRPPPGSDVGELPAFAAAKEIVELPGRTELWKGIPRHPTRVEIDSATRRAEGLFAPTPVQLAADDAQWLRRFCTQDSRFSRMEANVYKLCGWFHADWAVVFTAAGRTAEFDFCFGCDEVKILVDGFEPLHLDLSYSGMLHLYFADIAK